MFESPRSEKLKRRVVNALLAIDSFIDSSLFDASRRIGDVWRGFSGFMERFHVRGLTRFGAELAGEALTMGLGGALVMLALAVPAFRFTADDWLKKTDIAVTFQDRFGVEVGRRGILHDDAVPLDQYPSYVIQAVLSTEDRRFFDHWGIDPVGLVRALSVNARNAGVVQGGSTITQQLAKNLFLSNERTLTRKVNEAFLALWLEGHLSKREILQLYLDRAYMGGGTFGIQAAAQFYFGKSIRDVTLAQAAMLAGLFKAPAKYAPHVNLPAARARANDVLANMVAAGYRTQNQIEEAQLNPASPLDRDDQADPDWYLDWAFGEIKALADSGKLGSDRVFTVRTALDSGLQKHAESIIETMLRESGPSYHAKQSAAIVMEPLGAVHAIVGGRDYGVSQFNRAIDAQRQPGSSFKPYVYLTALMTGKFKPTTTIVDAPICIVNWCPHNYGGSYGGAMPLANALAHSLNTVAVRLSIAIGDGNPRLGRARIIETAHRMGVTAPLPDTQSLPLGADDVSVMDQVTGYAVFANGGKRIKPYAAMEIRNSRGEVIYTHERDGPQPQQVIEPRFILDMDSMLRGVVEAGTGRRAQLPGVVVAGKTGTTNGYKDAWFCGFTGNFVGAVWFGNDDDQSMENMTGGTLPAMTWHDIMEYAHRGVDLKPMPGAPAAPPQDKGADVVAAAAAGPRSPQLSHQSIDALGNIETLMKASGKGGRAEIEPLPLSSRGLLRLTRNNGNVLDLR